MAGKISKEGIEASQHFCMLPWTHLHVWPNSNTYPCCVADSDKPLGRYAGQLSDLVNSEPLKKIRTNMINDLPSEECRRCYELEKNKIYSLRQNANTRYARYFEDVEKTLPDGSVEKFTMRYLDIRFSNLCNFKCRSCGPSLSTSWFADQEKLQNFKSTEKMLVEIEPKENFWNDLLPSLAHVEEAYFAGGEPLITDEIYRIMDHWIANGNTQIQLGFTTNFSRLTYKERDILEYWKKFPNTTVSASLDDSGPRAEYLRKGTVWKNIVENRKRMLREAPEVIFELTPTISVLNVWHFPEFHYEWLKEGLVSHQNLRLNLLTEEPYLSIKIIPLHRRKPLLEKWRQALSRLEKEFIDVGPEYFNKTRNGYNSVITALENEEHSDLRKDFYKRNKDLDRIRNEMLDQIYPEVAALLAD